MGIDVYMQWNGITVKEEMEQICDCSSALGHLGYLWERNSKSYRDWGLLLPFFVREAFEDAEFEAKIRASVLRERLESTVELWNKRHKKMFGDADQGDLANEISSLIDFVDLAERKEKETGEPVLIRAAY